METIPKETIERAAKGEIGAFESIYKVTSGFVYRVALRVVNNDADAKEVTQDTFMKIYDNLKDFQFRSNFKTWVYRITVNTAVNVYNRNLRQNMRRADFDVALASGGHEAEVHQEAQKSEAESRLSSLLNILAPQQRAVVVLREIEGLSYEEIAEVMKINLNTVRSRLKRARDALMEQGKEAVER